jgi:hypothetical protein
MSVLFCLPLKQSRFPLNIIVNLVKIVRLPHLAHFAAKSSIFSVCHYSLASRFLMWVTLSMTRTLMRRPARIVRRQWRGSKRSLTVAL